MSIEYHDYGMSPHWGRFYQYCINRLGKPPHHGIFTPYLTYPEIFSIFDELGLKITFKFTEERECMVFESEQDLLYFILRF